MEWIVYPILVVLNCNLLGLSGQKSSPSPIGSTGCRSPSNSGESVKREDLFFALNETTHALRFAESAAKRFAINVDELEAGSPTAISIAYIKNRLSDAHDSLAAAEGEIGRLIHIAGFD